MTSEEKQEIINAVLAAIRTNSKSIDQLTPVSEMSDTDFLELNGGRKVSYGVLFANHMSNDEAQEAWEYLDTKKVDKDSRGLVEVHQAPVVFLDAMGVLDGHALNGGEGLEYRPDYKQIFDFPGGLFGAPKAGAVYISKNNFKKFVWNGTDLEELKADECPLFVDYSEPVAFATLPVGGSYYVPSSHNIAVKIDASNTKTYDPLPDALYFFRDKGMIYTWKSSTNKWVPAGSDIKVINDLTTGGEGDALSAEMGKWLYTNLYTIFTQLGTYAFPNGRPQIDWGGGNPPVIPPCTVSKTIGTGLSSTGGDSDVAFGDPLEVSIAIANNLYIVDDDSVEVTMGGSPVQGAWNASTMKVTIAAVTGNVVINVPSMTYVDGGHLVVMFDGKNRGDVAGEWTDLKDNTRKLILTNCTENTDSVTLDGSTSTAMAATAGVGVDVPRSSGTIEAVATGMIYSNGNAQSDIIIANKGLKENGNIIPVMAMGLYYGTAFNNGLGAYWFNKDQDATGEPYIWILGKSSLTTSDILHLSLSSERGYLNGAPLSRSSSTAGVRSSDYSRIGVFSNVGSNGSNVCRKGTMYCARIYDKILSADEVAQNYKVDRKRFNLI